MTEYICVRGRDIYKNKFTHNLDHVRVSHPIATLRSSLLIIGRLSGEISGRARGGSFRVVCGRNEAAEAAALVRCVARQTGLLGEDTRFKCA
jgi:hypothetical protein